MRLKVEHAEPGTDPTLIETPMRTQSGLAYAIKQNWWVVLGLAVVIFGLTRDKDAPKKQQADAPQPTPTAALVAELPAGWCEGPGGAPVPPGLYTIGSQQRRCENEAWFLIDEP